MKILAITGSRSDYDLLQPVLQAIESSTKHGLFLFVSCAHLARAWGGTVSRISGFQHVIMRPTLIDWDTPEARLKSMSLELAALAQDMAEVRPDLVLILGDREDTLMAATAAAYSWIPVAHIFGGDMGWSTVDDSVRHAVSKLSHLHFAASSASRDVLLKLGEDPARVHVSGNPALDRIASHRDWTGDQLASRFGLVPGMPLALVTHHATRPDPLQAEAELDCILEACSEMDLQVVVNTPNSDPGASGLLRARERLDRVIAVSNVEQDGWVALLKRCNLMLGNSSAGILESAFLRIPAINVGDRQRGRQHAGNVQFVPIDEESIRIAIDHALNDSHYREQLRHLSCPFGDGHAARRIMQVLDAQDPSSLIPKKHLLSDGGTF